MSRKTIIWIVAGVLAAAVLAAVAVVAYHIGFDHRAGGGGAILRRPLRDGGFGVAFGRRDGAAFPAVGAFLTLLIGGIVGGAIVYLWRGSVRPAGAIAAGCDTAAAGRPVDPRWRQFEEWHRYAHSPAGPGDPATGATTPGQAPMPGASTPPQAPTTPAQPPQPPAASE